MNEWKANFIVEIAIDGLLAASDLLQYTLQTNNVYKI